MLISGVDILQKKAKNALRGKNSAPAKFLKPSKISKNQVISLPTNYDIFMIFAVDCHF